MLKESDILAFRTENPKRIAIIYPPYGEIPNEPGIKVVKNNYGVFPSLSLLYVAGAARGAGHEVLFLDINARREPWPDIIARIRAFGPDYLLFTVTTYQLTNDIGHIRRFREELKLPVLIGGAHMGLYPEETMSHEIFDVGFIGECEISLPEFLERPVMDAAALADVPGIIFRDDGGKLVRNPAPPLVENLDNVHFPARDMIDNSLYYSFITKHRNFTPFMSSRGCPFDCIYCEQGHSGFRTRSAANVMAEIRECYERHGIREFDFFDANFPCIRDRVIELAEAIVESGMKIHWAVRARVDGVDEEMLRLLSSAGCERIYYGIESGDEEILKNVHKEISLSQTRKAIGWTRAAGIDAFGYFMFGSPGDSEESVRKTIRFACSLDLDYAQFSRAVPLPNTSWYSSYERDFGRDYWRETILFPDRAMEPIKRPGCDLSDAEITELCRQAYIAFYYRVKYIFGALRKIRSAGELFRYAKVALMMKFSH